MKFLNLSVLAIVLIVFSYVQCESHNDKVLERSPRSIGGLFRRLFGRRKQTGFQGTAQAQQDYNSQSSSLYPSYYNYYPYNYLYGNGYGQYQQQGAAANPAAYSGSYGSYPQAAAQYPTYALSPYGQQQQQGSGGSVDFHSVLDQFVKSAGLAPAGTGDQETSASNIQAKGDTPVFSFKRLYSFPFYLSTDGSSQDGYNLQVPYMKKHISRMAQDFVQRQQQQQQSQSQGVKHPQALQYYPIKNDQIRQMQLLEQQLAYNPHAFIQQYLQQLYNTQQAEAQQQAQVQQQQQQQQQQQSPPQQQSPKSNPQQAPAQAYDNQPSDNQDVAESQAKPTYYYKKVAQSSVSSPSQSSAINQQSSSSSSGSSAVQVGTSYAAH